MVTEEGVYPVRSRAGLAIHCSRPNACCAGPIGLQVVLLAAVALIPSVACRQEPIRFRIQQSPEVAAQFDREFGPYLAGDIGRSEWPSVVTYRRGQEEIYWREVVIDRQYNHGRFENERYRRFESIREGDARR